MAWCSSRSRSAVATTGSPKTSPKDASAIRERQTKDALRVDGFSLFGDRQIIEIEEILHTDCFQLIDVPTARRGPRYQGPDVTLVEIGDAFDAEPYSAKNEAAARAKGVKRVCIPNRSTKSLERKREQRKRWFRNGQKWRTGSEGRISVVKRRHGLDRCRYRGYVGINRWVGLGVIADNVDQHRPRYRKARGPLITPASPRSVSPAGHRRRVLRRPQP